MVIHISTASRVIIVIVIYVIRRLWVNHTWAFTLIVVSIAFVFIHSTVVITVSMLVPRVEIPVSFDALNTHSSLVSLSNSIAGPSSSLLMLMSGNYTGVPVYALRHFQ